MNDKFSTRIFKSRKLGNDICFIMTFFLISVRKMSGENSHCNEENNVKMIQIDNFLDNLQSVSVMQKSFITTKNSHSFTVQNTCFLGKIET